jgi:polyisoprenoid-binding protein YceI
MRLKNVLIGLAAAAMLLLGGVWFFFLRGDAPPEATLEGGIAAVTGGTTTTSGSTATGETPVATTAADASASGDGLDGSWVVDQSVSFVGYRIDEELASIGAATAVGRTSDIDASLTLAGTTISEVAVTVDMTTLESDQSRRDRAIETRGLETNSFPTAEFALTEPIDLGSVPVEGETITASAVGDLTLHGVTNQVSLDLEGSLVGGTMVVVGSTDITLTDYDIQAPTGLSVLGIAEVGELEFQLAFVRA